MPNKSPLPTGISSTVSPQPLRFRPAAGLDVRAMQMKSTILILFVLLTACTPGTKVQSGEHRVMPSAESGWIPQKNEPVPNVFGDAGRKTNLGHGFYEQDGCVASSSSWEAVAHYRYLVHNGKSLGISSSGYSISPSGRFAALLTGPYDDTIKIYDSHTSRYFLHPIPRKSINAFDWSEDRHRLDLIFVDGTTIIRINYPKP